MPRPIHLVIVLTALVLSCRPAQSAVTGGGGNAAPANGDSSEDWREDIKRQVYATVAEEDEKGFARLQPPKPGDWLSIYQEIPQPFEHYCLATRVKVTPQRRTIVLQPLGPFNDEQTRLVEAMRDYAESFFQLPARVAKSMELESSDERVVLEKMLPVGSRNGTYDRQYDADGIMEHLLAKHLPEDAAIYLGITMGDLYTTNFNYVFGKSSLDKRVGVYSLCRYFPEFWGLPRTPGDEIVALRRACKVLNHESSHMFGLTHCIFYRCPMNGSNSLSETDGAPMHECPVCHRKLRWNISFEPQKRFTALRTFFEKQKLDPEAAWMESRIKQWTLLTARENAPRRE